MPSQTCIAGDDHPGPCSLWFGHRIPVWSSLVRFSTSEAGRSPRTSNEVCFAAFGALRCGLWQQMHVQCPHSAMSSPLATFSSGSPSMCPGPPGRIHPTGQDPMVVRRLSRRAPGHSYSVVPEMKQLGSPGAVTDKRYFFHWHASGFPGGGGHVWAHPSRCHGAITIIVVSLCFPVIECILRRCIQIENVPPMYAYPSHHWTHGGTGQPDHQQCVAPVAHMAL